MIPETNNTQHKETEMSEHNWRERLEVRDAWGREIKATTARTIEAVLPGLTLADELTRAQSAFGSFAELLDAGGAYRPSLDCQVLECRQLADLYDAAQVLRNDSRQAYRYNNPPAQPARRSSR